MYYVSLYNVHTNSYEQFDKIVIKTYMFFKFFLHNFSMYFKNNEDIQFSN